MPNNYEKKIHTVYYAHAPSHPDFRYTGQTFQTLPKRWQGHQYEPRNKNSALWDALQIVPSEKWELWEIGTTKYAYTANHLEEVFQRLLGSYSPRGLNLAGGGRKAGKAEESSFSSYHRLTPAKEDLPLLWKREVALYQIRLILRQAGEPYTPQHAREWHSRDKKWAPLLGEEWEFKMDRPTPEEWERD